ncbi:MAG TPA: enoyl-CoA hydratase-related protein [Candidatus Dormibacteraeota bacterium]
MATGADVAAPSPVELARVELDPGGAAAIVTLNRPDQLNPIDWLTVGRLEEVLVEVDADPSVRTVLVTGRGRAFSAGGDLKSYMALQADPVAFPAFLEDLHRTFQFISRMRMPVVALVNGIAVAGGLELILSCDFAYAGESARVGDGHLTYGQMGGGGVLTLLPRAIGLARARELVFSGRWLAAEEAREWGIVNRVVPDGDLLAAGLEFATAAAERSALAMANAKLVMNAGWSEGTGVEQGLRLERERNAYYCLTSEDAREGLQAFQEKRRPRFRGR